MAKQRFVNTRFWSDGFVMDLNPLDRYLFLYFLTNEHTNIAGIYEVSLRTISFETGIEVDMLKKMLSRLKGKIEYIDGWVWVRNFERHQVARGNEKTRIGIERAKLEVPKDVMGVIRKLSTTKPKINSLSIGHDDLSAFDSDSDSDSDLDSDLDKGKGKGEGSLALTTPKTETTSFFQDGSKQDATIRYLVERGMPEEIARREISKFVSYWTEPNGNGLKQRWELEKTFEIRRRLVTWMQNAARYSKSHAEPKGIRL